MNTATSLDCDVWCVDLSAPHGLARETVQDRAEMLSGGPTRLVRRRLLRAELAVRWSVHPDALNFQREASGQVRVSGPKQAFVSTAHRGQMVVMAVSNEPVGVDLEPVMSVIACDIADVCPQWDTLDPTARWTAFEALGKLFCVGTAVPVRAIVTRSVSACALRLSLAGRKVRIALFPCNEHQIAVAEFEE